MTPHEQLTTLIKSQLPRLRDWEIEGLVKVIVEAGYALKKPMFKKPVPKEFQ